MTDHKGEFEAWMSHGDKATQLPAGFRTLATTRTMLLRDTDRGSWAG